MRVDNCRATKRVHPSITLMGGMAGLLMAAALPFALACGGSYGTPAPADGERFDVDCSCTCTDFSDVCAAYPLPTPLVASGTCIRDSDSNGTLNTASDILAGEFRCWQRSQWYASGVSYVCGVSSGVQVSANDVCLPDTGAPLLDSGRDVPAENRDPVTNLAEVGWGTVAASSTVGITSGSSSTTLTPTGWVSVRDGYCPGGTCPLVIQGLYLSLPNFTLNGVTVNGGELRSFGGWDGEKASSETYRMFDQSAVEVTGIVNGSRMVRVGSSAPAQPVTGEFRMVASPLPPPLTGSARYATVNGTFNVPATSTTPAASFSVNVVVPLTRGAPTPSVTAIAQPPCGTAPCGGTTYNASASKTFGGSSSVSYRWIDANFRVVGTGSTLDSNVVTLVSGRPNPWPVMLEVTDQTVGGNVKPASRSYWGPGSLPLRGERSVQEGFGRIVDRGHFNMDGYEDLVVGSPDDGVASGASRFGSVTVIFGGRPDLRRGRDFYWRLPAAGASASDDFGASVAVGDFNGDGRPDLAAGAPGRSTSGRVYVAYFQGRALSPLPPAGATYEIDGATAPSWIAGNTGFGATLTASDVNNDGADDLIVGAPNHDGSRGAIWIYYGKPGVGIVTGAGAVRAPHRIWLGGFSSSYNTANRRFASALARGDINGDGRGDVIVGASGQATGLFVVLFGAATGLETTGFFLATGAGRLGSSLVAEDFTGDGLDDVAVSAPEDSTIASLQGAVRVYRGASSGFGSSFETYRQSSSDPGGSGCRATAANDRFGTGLAARQIDGDVRHDLLVTAAASTTARQMVFVLRTGVSSPLGRVFHMPNEQCFARTVFITSGTASLGNSITALDVAHDTFSDVVVGSPNDDFAAGRVSVLPNLTTGGLSSGSVYGLGQSAIN